MALFFYRVTVTLAAPLFVGLWLVRWLRGAETLADLGQRFGGTAGNAGAIWLHGASNGELTSARPLIDGLLDEFPGQEIVVTANTTTGRDLVRNWDLPRVTALLAPLDLRWTLSRFRTRWCPNVLIVLENELWPNRILSAQEPVLCVGARMSAKSAARWARLGGLARLVLQRVDWLSPQDQDSAARFISLGLQTDRLGPEISLKQLVRLPPPQPAEFADLQQYFTRADTVLAASTHEGEEAIILSGFATALADNQALKLIMAPRHQRRSAEIAELIRQTGLAFAVRSKGQSPDRETIIYLADTMGEMSLWYALSGVSFVGGSLVEKGGHTPFEPAMANSVILHGPHVANFSLAYRELDQAQAALLVADGAGLAAAITDQSGAEGQEERTRLAKKVLSGIGDATAGTQTFIDALRRLLPG